MEYSAGIILWRKDIDAVRFLLVSPGGPLWGHRECWGFPKGHIEETETPFESALRETIEETNIKGLSDNEKDYTYHGLIKQRSNKSVYAYSKEYNNEDISDLHSNLFVWEKDGKEYPEIGKYKWMSLNELKSNGCGIKSYFKIYEELTNDRQTD